MKCSPMLPLLVILALALPAPLLADTWSLEAGGTFARGDYGTGSEVESWSLPLTLGWNSADRWDVQVGTALVHVSDDSTVGFGSTRVSRRMGGESGTGGSGPMGNDGTNGNGGGRVTAAATAEPGGAATGVGDVQLEVGYRLLTEGARTPWLRGLVAVKLPTADEERGLGTGEVDVAAGLGAGRRFGPWSALAEARYLVPGQADDLDLKDVFSLEAEAGVETSSRLYAGLNLWYATPAAGDADPQLELRGKLILPLSSQLDLKGFAGLGLADGSPDWSAGLSAVSYF